MSSASQGSAPGAGRTARIRREPARRRGRWSDPRAGSRRIRAARRRSSARRPPPGGRPAVETSPGYRFVADPRDPETELARAGALVLVVVVVIMIILPMLLGLAAVRI